jgi:hypothetical protein
MRRRRFLGLAGGSALSVAGGVAVNNVLLGYGTVTGTNLHEQDLATKANDGLGPPAGRSVDLRGRTVELADAGAVVDGDDLAWTASREEVESFASDHGLPADALAQLVADVPRFREEEHAVKATGAAEFFERAAAADTRAHTVAALRGPRVRDVRPSLVEQFLDADPADPEAVAYGLVDAFRAHTFYDAPRYVAGAVEDNVLRETVDLREHFESPTGFGAMLDGENDGAFCYDFVYRSMEALQAVDAPDQTVPVVAGYVRDTRHKHAFTGLATVVREDGGGGSESGTSGEGGPGSGDGTEVTLLLTFLDYTPTTTAHSFGVTRAVGDDPDAYTTGHRATEIVWNKRTST